MIRYDFHTHRIPMDSETVALVSGCGLPPSPHCFRSEELHPWSGATEPPDGWELRAREADAIGEIGLDRLRGAPWPDQLILWERLLDFAARNGKPVILHIVRGLEEVLRQRRRHPRERWLWHGWRNDNPAALERILAAGIRVGIGIHTPDAAIRQIGAMPDLLALESDDEPDSLPEIYRKTAALLGMTEMELAGLARGNFERFLGLETQSVL